MRPFSSIVLLLLAVTSCESRRSGDQLGEITTRVDAQPHDANPAMALPAPSEADELLARLGDASLVRDMTAAQIAERAPAVRVEAAADRGGHALFGPDGALLAWYQNGDELCFKGPGIVDAAGIEVGRRLATIPGAREMGCEIATGNELLHLGDACPSEIADQTMLVCELGSPFRRLFFVVDHEYAKRAGDELSADELDAFGEAELFAMHLLASAPDPEPPKSPGAEPPPDAVPTKLGAVLAQIPSQPEQLRAGTPTTIAAIEAALPGFQVKARRHYGLHVYRGSIKVATVMATVGKPFDGITLYAPGLADPRGVEVGVAIAALAEISGLTCAIEGDADWPTYVGCSVADETFSRYVFAIDLDSERLGEALTFAEATALLGETTLTAIEIGVPEF